MNFITYRLTNELIGCFGKVNKLKVINSNTSRVFEASINPLSDARNRLVRTDYFVRGLVKIEGALITIDVGLYDQDETEIWSSRHQNDITLLPELTGQIVAEITEFLKIKLEPGEFSRITDLKPIDPEIYQLWVKAWNQLYKMSAESFSEARFYFNEAVDRSPGDARTWAMLAEGLVTMGHSDKPPDGVWREGKAAALRALQLDSLNADAWAALAHIKTYFEWDYDGAEYCYSKANYLNPSIAMNHYHYAWHLFLHDQLDEAIEEHLLAQELDPLQPGHTGWLARLYAEKGEFALAMSEIDRTARIIQGSDFVFRRKGDVYLLMEEYDSALYYYKKGKIYPKVAITYFRKGDFDNGMETLAHVLSYPINSWHAHKRAQLYAEIDSLDRFFEYANYDPPHAFAPWLRKTIINPKIIQDSRYKELMDKMNLPMPMDYD
jgi:tetratricopeptide (TPR) repeat protein